MKTKNEEEIFGLRCTHLGLTKREIEICELVWEGLIYKEIGESPFTSDRTMYKHMQNFINAMEQKQV